MHTARVKFVLLSLSHALIFFNDEDDDGVVWLEQKERRGKMGKMGKESTR